MLTQAVKKYVKHPKPRLEEMEEMGYTMWAATMGVMPVFVGDVLGIPTLAVKVLAHFADVVALLLRKY